MAETLTRWDPFAELGELRTHFDRMFDGWLDGRERAWRPAIDVVREDGHLVVHADLPGIESEEVKIEVEDDILTVSGDTRRAKRRRTAATCGASAVTGPSVARWRCPGASMPRRSRQRHKTASSR